MTPNNMFSRRALLRTGAIGAAAVGIGGIAQTPASATRASDIYYIKTSGTISGKVEIFTATVSSRYQTTGRWVTWISANEHRNGEFQMVGRDLYFIKSRNTRSGAVEIHNATRSSSYRSASMHATTLFKTWDADNGWFQMVGRNLYFIKTKRGGTGRVEVYSATASSKYRKFGVRTHTLIGQRDADNGTYQMVGRDLYFIKTQHTGTRTIEVFSATASSGYRSLGVHTGTRFPVAEGENGTFQIVGRDLYFMKSKRTNSGRVEVYCATAATNFKTLSLQMRTWMNNGLERSGVVTALMPNVSTRLPVVPTSKPTTIKPTTVKPTVAKPTTAKPTTKPTIVKPTTVKPTTKPTTAKPTTSKPTTSRPTTSKPTTQPTTQPGPSTWEVAGVLLAKIQSYRASRGVPRLRWNATLTSVAKSWSASMARANRLGHNPYLDSQAPRGWSSLAENVAFYTGSGTAEQVAQVIFNSWVNSYGHRANILASKYNHSGLGVGRASNGTWYATHDFARY